MFNHMRGSFGLTRSPRRWTSRYRKPPEPAWWGPPPVYLRCQRSEKKRGESDHIRNQHWDFNINFYLLIHFQEEINVFLVLFPPLVCPSALSYSPLFPQSVCSHHASQLDLLLFFTVCGAAAGIISFIGTLIRTFSASDSAEAPLTELLVGLDQASCWIILAGVQLYFSICD